jgi:hypothetical protein
LLTIHIDQLRSWLARFAVHRPATMAPLHVGRRPLFTCLIDRFGIDPWMQPI